MKKIFSLGFVITAIGAVMLLFGFANHGLRSVVWHNGFKVEHQTATVKKLDAFKSVELATNQPVSIVSGDVQQAQITTSDSAIKTQISDGVLKVTGNVGDRSDVHFLFGGYSDRNARTIQIVVPKTTKLNTIDATTKQMDNVRVSDLKVTKLSFRQDGNTDLNQVNSETPVQIKTSDNDISFHTVTAPTVDLDCGDGDIVIEQSHFMQPAKVHSADGDLTIKANQLTSLTATTNDGDVVLRNNQPQSKVNVTTQDGDIDASISSEAGLKAHVSDGDLKVNGHKQYHHFQRKPAAKVQYQLTAADGDLTVN